jgi:flagellar biosynthesis chaperone FliJ
MWQTARARLKALSNAVARHRARERQRGARGEQRQLDEHAARRTGVLPD